MNPFRHLTFSAPIFRAPESEGGGEAATGDTGAEGGIVDEPDLMDSATVDAGGGSDTVDAGNGADTLEGGQGNDTVEGADGNDGLPEGVPEKYELTAPEGFDALDAAALEAATPILQKLGVKTNEQAQEVVNAFAKDVLPGILAQQAQTQAQGFQDTIVATRKEWAEEVKKDPELAPSTDALKATLAKAAKARDHFATPELKTFLKETGIGNHKEVIRLFAKIGDQISEGTFHRPDGSAQEKSEPWAKAYDPAFHPKA